jgi:hypothetical protein
MKLRLPFIVFAVCVPLLTCNKYPDQSPGDYSIKVTWPANPQSLIRGKSYTLQYKTGQDKFDQLYASISPAGFIDTAAVNQSLMNSATKSFTVTFLEAGACTLSVAGTTTDNRTFRDFCALVVVKPRPRPEVTGVTVSYAAIGLFVNDEADFQIAASDTDGLIDSCRVVLKKTAGSDSLVFRGGSLLLHYTMPVSAGGVYTVDAYARDTDGVWSPAWRNPTLLTVLPGAPQVTSFSPNNVTYDTTTYHYSAKDTNGLVKKIIIAWGDGTADTVNVIGNRPSYSDSIRHWYPADDTFHPAITAIGDDSLSSTMNATVVRKRGTASITALRDTFPSIEEHSYGGADSFYFAASASTAHGAILQYVWILRPPLVAGVLNYDTVGTNVPVLNLNSKSQYFQTHPAMKSDTAYQGAVEAIYDDNVKVIDSFYFWAEGALSFGPVAHAVCKLGVNLDSTMFKYANANSLDSFYIDITSLCYVLQLNDTVAPEHYEAKIQCMIDSSTDAFGTLIYWWGDARVVKDMALLPSFMTYLALAPRWNHGCWRYAWRPPDNFFTPYQTSAGSKLNFHFQVTILSHSGLQRPISCQSLHLTW